MGRFSDFPPLLFDSLFFGILQGRWKNVLFTVSSEKTLFNKVFASETENYRHKLKDLLLFSIHQSYRHMDFGIFDDQCHLEPGC